MRVREVLKVLHSDGWKITSQRGSHIQLEHPSKKGKVTVPNHTGDVSAYTLKSIWKQAGIAP